MNVREGARTGETYRLATLKAESITGRYFRAIARCTCYERSNKLKQLVRIRGLLGIPATYHRCFRWGASSNASCLRNVWNARQTHADAQYGEPTWVLGQLATVARL